MSEKYGFLAKSFHWVMALIVLCLLLLGNYMEPLDSGPFKWNLYGWHKSFGILVFALVFLRLVWRFMNPPPAPLETQSPWEHHLAKIIHILLYIGMIGMPLSGLLMSMSGGHASSFFGLFDIPDLTGKNKLIHEITEEIHEITSQALLLAVILHAVGAFKHHFMDKDQTLRRMLPAVLPKAGVFISVILFILLVGSASFLWAKNIVMEEFVEHSSVERSIDTSINDTSIK